MKAEFSKRHGGDREANLQDTFPILKEVAFPGVFVLLAFLLRFFLIPQDTTINGDGIYYVTHGLKIISGNLSDGISAYWSPLYSILIGISTLFFQDTEFAGRIVSVVAGSLLVIPSYVLIREFFGNRPAYIGTILVVIHPSLIASSEWVMTESLYALVFTTAVLLGWFALKTVKVTTFFATGLLLGVAYLTKPEAAFFVALFSVFALGRKFFRPKTNLRSLAAGYLILLTGFLVFFLPYVIFIHQKTGLWTISQKLFSNSTFNDSDRGMLKLTDDGQTTMQDRIWWDVYQTENKQPQISRSVEHGSANGTSSRFDITELTLKTLNNLKKQLKEHTRTILPFPFLLIAAIGFFMGQWTMQRAAKETYLLSFVACTFLGYAVTVIELRYLYALIPILLGWVAFGIASFGDFVSKTFERYLRAGSKIKPVLIQTLILILLAISLEPLFSFYFGPAQIQDTPLEEKLAGLWLKDHSEPGSLVMAPNATVAFYAGARHTFLPDEEFSTILEYARRKKVDYVVLNERRLRNRQDAFRLAEEHSNELKLVFQDSQIQNYEVRIYRMVE